MEVVLLKHAKADRDYWKNTGDPRILKPITALLKDIELHPFFWYWQARASER